MKLSSEDIIAALHGTLEPRSEILFAYIFGSFIEESKFRDLDVGVFVTDPALVAENITYTIRLSLELEERTGYPVDVILMNSAPDHLIHSISKGMLVVNRDETFREDFIAAAWSRYIDFRPMRRQAVADLFE
jgi:hypothetical protein